MMYLTELLFCDKRKFKRLNMALTMQMVKKETSYFDTLFVHTFWCKFSKNFDGQRDFGKTNCHRKSTRLDHPYLKYALAVNWNHAQNNKKKVLSLTVTFFRKCIECKQMLLTDRFIFAIRFEYEGTKWRFVSTLAQMSFKTRLDIHCWSMSYF